MWLFVAFLALPLIEIALLVTVGGYLGLWWTLTIVIGTAVAGILVIRWQGLHAAEGLQRAAELRRNPVGLLAGNALIVFAALMLILPGFLTDTLGLLLLLPPVRHLVVRGLSMRAQVFTTRTADGPRRSGPDVIDGEFFEIEQDQVDGPPNGHRPSGWTRH